MSLAVLTLQCGALGGVHRGVRRAHQPAEMLANVSIQC